jgi:hypothetical protein
MYVSRLALSSAVCALAVAGSVGLDAAWPSLANRSADNAYAAGGPAAAPPAAAQVSPHADHTLPHDTIPDFCASPTIRTIASGPWSSASIWSPSRLPGAGDVVEIATGTVVTLDSQMPDGPNQSPAMASAITCVGVNGRLQFSTTVSTRLWAGDIMVHAGGDMTVGDVSAPVPADVTAEIVIANQSLNLTTDPGQYGTGLIVMGRLAMHGAEKDPTFVRLASEPAAGATTVLVAQPLIGWRAGDRIVIPDTRHLHYNHTNGWGPTAPQYEERTVTAISPDGLTVTLNLPLTYAHRGARDVNGSLTFLPHIGNLTRNVIVRSEVPMGAAGTRGHTMMTHRADVDIRYALFKGLGRTTIAALNDVTNHIGRYPLHMHHLMGPLTTPTNGHQFTLIGNAIDGGTATHDLKWGLAVHNTHYGLITDNVVYNFAGALVMFEDGSESFNVLDHNFAMRSTGTGERFAEGTEGGGFWFRGPNNHVTDNVAANVWSAFPEAAYGYKYFMRYLGNIRVPTHKGADTSVSGQFTTRHGNNMPILEFDNNEVYGAAQGLTYWWVNSLDPTPMPTAEESTFRNVKIWHVFNMGVYHYPSIRVVFDGLVIRGSGEGAITHCCGIGWFGADYPAGQIVIRNSDIQGMSKGISLSSFATDVNTYENTFLSNDINVEVSTLRSSNGGSAVPPRTTILRNLRFQPWPRLANINISMNWNAPVGGNYQFNTTQTDRTLVYQHNGVVGDNLQIFFWQQATLPVAGGLAPCATTRSGISGIACRLTVPFTDSSLSAGSSVIRLAHIEELRTRIDAVRTRLGLPTFPWTDSTLAAGATRIQAAHINELRTAVAQAYAADGQAAPTYTDPVLGPGIAMKAAHVTELRAAVFGIE